MKLIFLIITCILLFTSCKQNIENKTEELLANFPKEWKMLTEINGEKVIYQACDAANRNFWIENKQNTWIFNHEEGHETMTDTIISFNRISDTEFKLILHSEYTDSLIEMIISEYDSGKTSKWSWSYSNFEMSYYFVSNIGKSDFKYVEQPCRECWDDEICDEKE